MKADYGTPEEQLQYFERELGGLKSYVKELTDRAVEHGTESVHFEADLIEARHNVEYYEGEIALLREMIGKEGGGKEGKEGKESEGPAYSVYQDAAGEWRWRLRAANNRIIADSGEGYRNRQDCLHAINLVKDSKNAPVDEGR